MSAYRLDSEFQILGEWFLKNNTLDESIKGTLFYSEKEIILELYDAFGNIFNDEYSNLEFIYGFSTDGKTVLLNNLSMKRGKENFPGFPTINYYVQDFLILQENYNNSSELYDLINHITSQSLDNFQVRNTVFTFDSISEWMHKSTIQKMKDEKNNIITLKADLGNYEVDKYVIPNQDIMLKENIKVTVEQREHIVTEEHALIIEPTSKRQTMDFANSFDNANRIKHLVEFFVNYPLKFNYIEFHYEDINPISEKGEDKEIKIGRYFFTSIGERLTEKPKLSVKYTDIRNEFEHLLKNWFLKEDELEFIINSFIGDIYMPNYINTQLLNSIRNLEIYHRHFIDKDNKEPHDEFLENEISALITFVENNISTKNQSRFIRNIQYNPETNLNKRLVELFKLLPLKLSESIIKQPKKSLSKSINSFAYKLTQIRNYFTHGDDKEKFKDIVEIIENGLKMYEYNRKLKIIIKYFIYKELGMSEDLILKILK